MSQRRELLAFAAFLQSELFPDKSPYAIADLAEKLLACGTTYQRLCTEDCNLGLTEAEQRKSDRVEEKVRKLLEGTQIKPIFAGDPRGHTIKLQSPSKQNNSFGGEGWCIPTS